MTRIAISFDEAGTMLDDIVASLPKEIFVELNGGVNLLPDTKLHPVSLSNETDTDVYILGEYCNDRDLGRFVNIYYGSFVMTYGSLSVIRQREKLKGILTHELTHHLESMAGERDLEIQDARDIEVYKRKV